MSTADAPARESLRSWAPDAAVGLGVLALGLVELRYTGGPRRLGPVSSGLLADLALVTAYAVACGLSRRAPGLGLAVVWVAGLLQVVTDTPMLSVQFTVAVLAFGCARWGSVPTVVLSGLSIPAAAAVGALAVASGHGAFFRDLLLLRQLVDNASRLSDTLVGAAVILGGLVLALPWLAGLALRALARALTSEARRQEAEEQAAQAQEIARLRERQASLAHDVHDVVGHSLAVVLAQAESAQYLDDPADLKATLATIATSARASLRDVRGVLADDVTPPGDDDLARLLQGVRAAGRDVVETETGAARPLPPDLAVVAHRVMQEMLTNAVKHGDPDQPVRVSRHWPHGAGEVLRIEVANVESGGVQEAGTMKGMGIEGIRRRLGAVGGQLQLHREDGWLMAVAYLPVSTR